MYKANIKKAYQPHKKKLNMKINDLSFFLIRESRSQGKLHTELWREAVCQKQKLLEQTEENT